MIEISGQDIEILAEFQRRSEHAINKYKPTNKPDHNQTNYHKSNARYRLLFGGNQSGKSHAAAYDCACNARGRNPFGISNITGRDVEIWVISAEYSTIKTGIYRHLCNIIPDWDILTVGPNVPGFGKKLPTYMEVKRPDGFKTTISFMSAKGEGGARGKFQAAAIDYFYIDEEISADIWEELEARTLATGGRFSISATLVESYEWILDLEREGERGNPHVFITRLNTESNDYLDKETVQLLKNKWSSETKEYRFYGKSRRIRGLVYNTWDDNKHVIAPIEIPLDWPRWCAIDPGIRTCAALWVAVGPDEKAYGYRELYAHNEPLWEVALSIKKIEGWDLNEELTASFKHYVWEETRKSEKLVSRIIDPKSRARSEAGEASILDQLYTRYGLVCTPADNSLRPGLEDCRYWLEHGFCIFDNLTNFQEERRVYRYRPPTQKKSQNDPIEDPIKKHNHLMDCWRYIARESPHFVDRHQLEEFQDVKKYISPHQKLAQKRAEADETVHEVLGECW